MQTHIPNGDGFFCGTDSVAAACTTNASICRVCLGALAKAQARRPDTDTLVGMLRRCELATYAVGQKHGESPVRNRAEAAAYKAIFKALTGRKPTSDELARILID